LPAVVRMVRMIRPYRLALATRNGHGYTALACGRPREDGTWEGWLEFVSTDGSEVLHSPRETTQPNVADLEHWASGLTPVYLEGALHRAIDGPIRGAAHATDERPAAILDPFIAYGKGESLLRAQLAALAPLHLRNIARAYDLAPERERELEQMAAPELIELIVRAVRARAA
jgi:hypothetical protein